LLLQASYLLSYFLERTVTELDKIVDLDASLKFRCFLNLKESEVYQGAKHAKA